MCYRTFWNPGKYMLIVAILLLHYILFVYFDRVFFATICELYQQSVNRIRIALSCRSCYRHHHSHHHHHIIGVVAARCMTAAAHVSEPTQGDRRDREPGSREADTRDIDALTAGQNSPQADSVGVLPLKLSGRGWSCLPNPPPPRPWP